MAQSNLRWHHKFQLTQQDSYFSAYNTSINDLILMCAHNTSICCLQVTISQSYTNQASNIKCK